MCQYVLMFTAVIKLRYEEGNLNMNHYMYFRRLVRLLDRQMVEIDRNIKRMPCKNVKKRNCKDKNDNKKF